MSLCLRGRSRVCSILSNHPVEGERIRPPMTSPSQTARRFAKVIQNTTLNNYRVTSCYSEIVIVSPCHLCPMPAHPSHTQARRRPPPRPNLSARPLRELRASVVNPRSLLQIHPSRSPQAPPSSTRPPATYPIRLKWSPKTGPPANEESRVELSRPE